MTYVTRLPRLTTVLRIILGLFMCLTGVMMFYMLYRMGQGGGPGGGGGGGPDGGGEGPSAFGQLVISVIRTGYLFQFLAVFKFLTGVLVLIPRTAPGAILAALAFYTNTFLAVIFLQEWFWLSTAVPTFSISLYMIWAYWDRYRHMIEPSRPAAA